WFYTRDGQPPRPDLRRARRPDAPRDPRPPRRRGGGRDGAREALPHEPAGDLEASEGARAGRAHRPQPPGAVAALPARGAAAAGGGGLDRALSALLGEELRAPRCLPRQGATQGEKRWSEEPTIGAASTSRW